MREALCAVKEVIDGSCLDQLQIRTILVKVWCAVVCCGVLWCGVLWCGVVWCAVVWCGVMQCPTSIACESTATGGAVDATPTGHSAVGPPPH